MSHAHALHSTLSFSRVHSSESPHLPMAKAHSGLASAPGDAKSFPDSASPEGWASGACGMPLKDICRVCRSQMQCLTHGHRTRVDTGPRRSRQNSFTGDCSETEARVAARAPVPSSGIHYWSLKGTTVWL